VRTTACSTILGNFVPPYESTVTSQLWRDGAVMLGKLNNDEFAMGSSNETSSFGPVVNPWRRAGSDVQGLVPGEGNHLVPGGRRRRLRSSRGYASRATATDTGGSIRQPAAFTGTVGIKPTYGRCSRWGTVAFASSLDQAGPIAKSVRDCAVHFCVDVGPRSEGLDLRECPVPDLRGGGRRAVKGLKIGIPRNIALEGMPPEIDAISGSRAGLAEERAGADDRRYLAAAHQICPARLLHRRAGGGLLQPRPL
jgi:aspartyl-tRNA(Asn)/glutamyl-tRNA(Gln) amidotransferase subunit A